jgi:hypothetical protein
MTIEVRVFPNFSCERTFNGEKWDCKTWEENIWLDLMKLTILNFPIIPLATEISLPYGTLAG